MNVYRIIVLLFFSFLINISPAYSLINVGTIFFNPPFVMPGGIGFDTEFIQLVCQKLHEKCEINLMNIDELYKAIDSGKVDLGMGGITIHAGRSPKYIYSLPYVLSKGDFMVLKDSSMKSIKDLSGQTVGIQSGNQDGPVFNLFLITKYTNDFDIAQFNNMPQLLNALASKRIAAAFIHESAALYWAANSGGQFRLLGQPEIVGDGIGIVASIKNVELIQRVDFAIRQLVQESAYMDLYNTYFGAER